MYEDIWIKLVCVQNILIKKYNCPDNLNIYTTPNEDGLLPEGISTVLM